MPKEKRISKKNKKKSLDKWNKVVLLTESGKNFENSKGFKNCTVVEKCGYCDEFKSPDSTDGICHNCPLNKNKVCNDTRDVYRYFYLSRGFPFVRTTETMFWRYVCEMRNHLDGKEVDRVKVVTLAKRIRNFIKNDPAEGD